MPCLVALIALAFPRVVIALLALFSGYLERAYDSLLWPVLGFLFMPLTTLAWAWAMNSRGSLEGLPLLVFIVAVLADLGTVGGSRPKRGYRNYFRR